MTAPTITDAMVEAAWFAWARSAKAYPNADAATTEAYYRAAMRAALEAAERAAWRPIEEAPEGVPCEFVFAEDRNERVSGVREGGQVRVRSVVFGLSLFPHFRPRQKETGNE